jgi:hypothetical protein
MKEIAGLVFFVTVLGVSVLIAINYYKEWSDKTFFTRIILSLLLFFGCVIAAYVILGLIGGFFWVIAWIGILINEVRQWLIEAILYPFIWIV